MRYNDKCVVEWKYRYRVSSEIYVGEYRMNTVHTDMINNHMTWNNRYTDRCGK
jgi:hypothetical protein